VGDPVTGDLDALPAKAVFTRGLPWLFKDSSTGIAEEHGLGWVSESINFETHFFCFSEKESEICKYRR
jgi:hypothetical protein